MESYYFFLDFSGKAPCKPHIMHGILDAGSLPETNPLIGGLMAYTVTAVKS
jgi:hypothetical protein